MLNIGTNLKKFYHILGIYVSFASIACGKGIDGLISRIGHQWSNIAEVLWPNLSLKTSIKLLLFLFL